MFDAHSSTKPKVAIGSCLLGEPVRFNGGHKKPNPHIEMLREHVELQALCPEVGIGMGVPRDAIRLVGNADTVRALDSKTQTSDYTQRLQDYAQTQSQQHSDWCGYIFVKGSPSCGMTRVTRYSETGQAIASDAAGVYAAAIMQLNPLLPVEEDGRLHNAAIRESFVNRIYLLHHWRQLLASAAPLKLKTLSDFYTAYKYLLMAHSLTAYKRCGQLLASAKKNPTDELAAQLIAEMMAGLKQPATRKGHTNALQHVQGYLKKALNPSEKQSLLKSIEQFRLGIVPIIVPITLLQHHFQQKPDAYIVRQVFLNPHPESMGLRSHLI